MWMIKKPRNMGSLMSFFKRCYVEIENKFRSCSTYKKNGNEAAYIGFPSELNYVRGDTLSSGPIYRLFFIGRDRIKCLAIGRYRLGA